MVQKYRDGEISQPGDFETADEDLRNAVESMVLSYSESMGDFCFHRALQVIWEVISMANKYIVVNEPWALAKNPDQAGRLDTVLYVLLECLRIVSLVLRPVMPIASDRMAVGLGLESDSEPPLFLDIDGKWGGLIAGSRVSPSDPLFPRLEGRKKSKTEKEKNDSGKSKRIKKSALSEEELISFDVFKKLDLRVAEIVAAKPVKKSNKLLKITVKDPDERVIVSGIAEHYQPSELIGRQVVIVANLKPVKIMGVTSQGMILTATEKIDGKERLTLSTVSETVAAGSRIE